MERPAGSVAQDAGRLVLGHELGVQLLAQQQQAVGDGGPRQPRQHADGRKDDTLVGEVDQAAAEGEAGLEHVAACARELTEPINWGGRRGEEGGGWGARQSAAEDGAARLNHIALTRPR